jgi:hypothetical protein
MSMDIDESRQDRGRSQINDLGAAWRGVTCACVYRGDPVADDEDFHVVPYLVAGSIDEQVSSQHHRTGRARAANSDRALRETAKGYGPKDQSAHMSTLICSVVLRLAERSSGRGFTATSRAA